MITFIDENGVTKTPDDFSLAVLPNHEHEAIPETNDRTLSIPERDGLLYYGSDLGAREFNIPMIVKPQDNKAMMQQRIRDFAGYMFNGYGKPKKIKMIFDYEPDKFYHVRFSGRVLPERLFRMAQFDLPLIADDPYAYAVSNVYSNNPTSKMVSGNEIVTFTNHGSIATPIRFEIEGSFSSLTISNVFAEKVISINQELTDEKLVIDTGKFIIQKETINQYTFPFLSASFPAKYAIDRTTTNLLMESDITGFLLLPGENEIFIGGENLDIKIEFLWYHKFL
jgi:predicted phage tail component-like protein